MIHHHRQIQMMMMSLNHLRRNPVRSDDVDCSFIFNYLFFLIEKENIINLSGAYHRYL